MIAQRFIVVRIGADRVAFDTMETINRIQWGVQQGLYHGEDATTNLRQLNEIRYRQLPEQEAIFVAMTADSPWSHTGHRRFMEEFGVRVDLSVYEAAADAAFGAAMVAVADTIDLDGHDPSHAIDLTFSDSDLSDWDLDSVI